MQYNTDEKNTSESKSFTVFMKLTVVIIFIAILFVTIYRYTLVSKAIDREQYVTALALSSPEIGTGVGALIRGLF